MFSAIAPQLDESLRADAERVADLSPYFSETASKDTDLFLEAMAQCRESLDRDALFERYDAFVRQQSDEDCCAALRMLRRREMMRIIFRDLARLSDLVQTTAELTCLADFCVRTALNYAYQTNVARYGQPIYPDGSPQTMVVLAMGKLGAFELNLSSDIDLIFLYEQPGVLERAGGKQMTYQEFFLRTARDLVACLDDADLVDNVFRVDMRLRPYGDSGPLVMARPGMETYYIEQGRDWERYAFIKARVIAGDFAAGEDFLDWMKHFVFRRHLDYRAIQSLRDMKGLIARQVELKESQHDLKLGAGGIREVEFIAQASQLIWGGKDPELQEPRLLEVLDLLVERSFLDAADAAALRAAYIFLRNSEHALQAQHDRQTHLLPDDEQDRRRLAMAMGFADFDDYLEVLDGHRGEVRRCFGQLVNASSRDALAQLDQAIADEWLNPRHAETKAFRDDVLELSLSREVQETLDLLMPYLLSVVGESADPGVARPAMIEVIRSILRRSTYLEFLCENLDAVKRAVALVTESSWFASQLAEYPIVLYELTDRVIDGASTSRTELEGELREIMRSLEPGDLEMQMDALRQFKLAVTTRIAAMELQGTKTIMEASDGLTALAEVLLERSCDLAWSYLEAKHGVPCDEQGQPLADRLAVIAYGKAGGFELAFGSDLDLVFLVPDDIGNNTDGKRPVNNNVFYVRLGQRLIHILTRFTRFGILYSVDMRLRPQGNNGPLVASVKAFERYQREDAWTWEHQALIRARFFAGDTGTGERFERIRRQIIELEREPVKLREDVLSMREKMREHLASPVNGGLQDGSEVLMRFDLKHDLGAIVDIEFMVQYAVLGSAATCTELSRWTDVMRLTDELVTAGVMDEQEVDALQRAYLTFRAAAHHEWLGLDADYERLQVYRQDVQRIWKDRMLVATPG